MYWTNVLCFGLIVFISMGVEEDQKTALTKETKQLEVSETGFKMSFSDEEAIVQFDFTENNMLRMTFDLKNKHWFGIAFGQAMIDVDLVTVEFDEDGNAFCKDRWSTQFAEPQEDDIQNVEFVSQDFSGDTFKVVCERPLITGDILQDTELFPGTTMIMSWAYSPDQTISYHRDSRGYLTIQFGLPPPEE